MRRQKPVHGRSDLDDVGLRHIRIPSTNPTLGGVRLRVMLKEGSFPLPLLSSGNLTR